MRTVDFQDGYGQTIRVQLSSGSEVRLYIEGKSMPDSPGDDSQAVRIGLLLPPEEARILVDGVRSMLREIEEA